MPKRPIELELIIKKDGWYFVRQAGSHRQYKPIKSGIVTIPFHSREVSKFVEAKVLKQAGINGGK